MVAILPWFLAGSLFPLTALPGWLAAVARILPTTHTLALLRYGVLGHGSTGLHDIWGFGSSTAEAALSLLVLAGWPCSPRPRPSGCSSARRCTDPDNDPGTLPAGPFHQDRAYGASRNGG